MGVNDVIQAYGEVAWRFLLSFHDLVKILGCEYNGPAGVIDCLDGADIKIWMMNELSATEIHVLVEDGRAAVKALNKRGYVAC